MQIPQKSAQPQMAFAARAEVKTFGQSFSKPLLEDIEKFAKKIGSDKDSFVFTLGSNTFWKTEKGAIQGYKLSVTSKINDSFESVTRVIRAKIGQKITPQSQYEDIISFLKTFEKPNANIRA